MGVLHIIQHGQRLPNPRDPVLQDLFTVGGWSDGEAEETEASSGDGDICWQGGIRGVTLAGDNKKGLGSVEVKAQREGPSL